MLKITGSEDFYPTPESLLDKITEGLEWTQMHYVLEPSAGRGNICEYLRKERIITVGNYKHKFIPEMDIDCIEIEPELRAILKEKDYRVIHDNFLTLHTYKHYDLIIMNPPFSQGARHLLKAIEVQQVSGGAIICILNAETIRNPYSNERKELQKRLEQYGAEIKYYEKAFNVAEHPTDVEVACVKLIVPEPERKTTIFETLRERDYEEYQKKAECGELAEIDLISAFVAQYNREIEWGLRLFDEFQELNSKSLDGESKITMSLSKDEFTVNNYVRAVRKKYWDKLFRHPRIVGRLTSNLQEQYLSQVNDFANYDFSYWNIKTVQEEIARSLVKGVEDCILDLFDELSARHSWDDDLNNNIHYYDGWKTNLSWKINKRVILKLNVFERYSNGVYHIWLYQVSQKLADIEKALNYLDNGETGEVDLQERLRQAERSKNMSNIQLKYFTATFYKKGTCHLTFTNERLLKKFNIFGSQRKGWLPKGYAKKRYEDMNAEEQAVINEFEGRNEYNATLREAQYYLFDATRSMPMLTA